MTIGGARNFSWWGRRVAEFLTSGAILPTGGTFCLILAKIIAFFQLSDGENGGGAKLLAGGANAPCPSICRAATGNDWF